MGRIIDMAGSIAHELLAVSKLLAARLSRGLWTRADRMRLWAQTR